MERYNGRREVCETSMSKRAAKSSDLLLKGNDIVKQVTDELCSHCEHAQHYITYCIKQANKGVIGLIILLRVVMLMSTV